MVAIAILPRSIAAPAAPAVRQPRLAPVGPKLVVDAGRRSAPTKLFRRFGLAVVVVIVALGVAFLVTQPPPAPAGHVPMLDQTHVVAEGETMWAVANQVAPAGEAAAYVERLVQVNGTAVVEPGQVLALPVP